MPGGLVRILFIVCAMAGVVGAMYAAAGAALDRPRLLRIDAAIASTLTADYSSDPHPERPRPPLNPDIIVAAVEDLDSSAGAPRTARQATPTPVPTITPATPTPAPRPTATQRPQPTATDEPPPTDTPEPPATDTPAPEPSPTATRVPPATKTPDPCKKKPWEDLMEDGNEGVQPTDVECPTATPYKTPYIVPTEVPLPR